MNPAIEMKPVEVPRSAVNSGDPWGSLAGVRQQLFEDGGEAVSVLIVCERSSERRMIASTLRRERMKILECESGPEALDTLAAAKLDLIILDRDMAKMDGLECCRRIKTNRSTALTPILMVTTKESVDLEIAGIQAGADEYLRMPLHPEVFRTRVRSLIRHKTAIDRLEETESILFALAQAVEKRDHYTAGHCQRLALFGVAFGIELGMSQSQLLALHRGGYLHDIGKIAIPDSILFKPGRLSPEEWTLMQTHSVRGEEICSPLHSLKAVWPIIRHHHERWDGSGYPDCLAGSKIPLLARVTQMADIYDALTTVRPYKQAFTTEQALLTMREETACGWRDPQLFETFAMLPFAQLDQAFRQVMETAQKDDFETSLRNVQRHLELAS